MRISTSRSRSGRLIVMFCSVITSLSSSAMRWRTTSGGTESVPWASSSTRRWCTLPRSATCVLTCPPILPSPGRDIPPARFSSVGARCGSGAGAGRSTSNGRGAGGAVGCTGAEAPLGRFCQPAGGNRSAPSSTGRSGVPEGADGDGALGAEVGGVPSAFRCTRSSNDMRAQTTSCDRVAIPARRLDQASPGCTPNGATILSKQRPRGSEGV